MRKNKISVCLLTYNHVNIVQSTIESVLNQSFADFELILSDDHSTDGTYEALLEMARRDKRIAVVQTPRNLGMPGNANFAIENSSGEYIALLHHDDVYRSDMLEKWLGVLERHADVGFVFNPYGIYGTNDVTGEDMPGEVISGAWLLKSFLFPRWGCLIRGTAMIRRTAWQSSGGMDVGYGLLADIDLWMKLAMVGRVGYVAEPIIHIRQDRPDYYPEIYQAREWSWPRLVYLYEIHARNRLRFFNKKSVMNDLRWLWFRCRLSAETFKWLGYAIVRRKRNMLYTCHQSETRYDLWVLVFIRKVVLLCLKP